MRHHVGSAENNRDEWRLGKGGEKKVPNRLWKTEREKKKGEIIAHRAACKTKYHLFVYRCTNFYYFEVIVHYNLFYLKF